MIRAERFDRWTLRTGRSGDGGAELARFHLLSGLESFAVDVELEPDWAGVGLGCVAT
jgi:hypothetical protein